MRPFDREGLRALPLAQRPVGQHRLGGRPDHLCLWDAGDPGGGRIPEQDDVVLADEEDAVADELERLRCLGAVPQLADEACVVHCDAGAARKLLGEVEIVLVEAVRTP